MKTMLTTLLLIIHFSVIGQVIKFNKETGLGQAQEIIESDKKANELYDISLRWVMSAFNNPDQVITGKMENEMIKGNGYSDGVKIAALMIVGLKYHFTIDVKDNKVRITFTDFIVTAKPPYSYETYVFKNDGSERTNPQASNISASSNEIIRSLINSYKKSITEGIKKDDW